VSLPSAPNPNFSEVVALIVAARQRAYQSINTTLIELYWQVGQYISRKIETAEWGDGIVSQLAQHLAQTQPSLRGFTRRNLFRMRQFFEAYRDDQIVSPLVTQLPWTQHLIILSQSKRPEEREFYVRMAIREHWSKRELERQFNAALFERTILTPPIVSSPVKQLHPEALSVFKDAEVVEYSLSRTLSQALIAQYQTQLPDKKFLAAKLYEFYLQNAPSTDSQAGDP